MTLELVKKAMDQNDIAREAIKSYREEHRREQWLLFWWSVAGVCWGVVITLMMIKMGWI